MPLSAMAAASGLLSVGRITGGHRTSYSAGCTLVGGIGGGGNEPHAVSVKAAQHTLTGSLGERIFQFLGGRLVGDFNAGQGLSHCLAGGAALLDIVRDLVEPGTEAHHFRAVVFGLNGQRAAVVAGVIAQQQGYRCNDKPRDY